MCRDEGRRRDHHALPGRGVLVAGTRYYTAGGRLPTTRETQSNLNRDGPNPVAEAAKREGARAKKPIQLSQN